MAANTFFLNICDQNTLTVLYRYEGKSEKSTIGDVVNSVGFEVTDKKGGDILEHNLILTDNLSSQGYINITTLDVISNEYALYKYVKPETITGFFLDGQEYKIGGDEAAWGNISGTLSDQTDLNTALSGKADSSDLNTKTFRLASTSDTDNILAIGRYSYAGGNPIIIFGNQVYVKDSVSLDTITYRCSEVDMAPDNNTGLTVVTQKLLNVSYSKTSGPGGYDAEMYGCTTGTDTIGSIAAGDMLYSDFNWQTKTGATFTLDLASTITPSANFTVNAPATLRDGQTYILRVNNGATAYTMTLGTGITNPFGTSLALTANGVDQFVFLAIGGDLELQPEIEGGSGGVTSVNGQTGAVTVQETLKSGTNIKTINSTSLLGNGNIAVQASLSNITAAEIKTGTATTQRSVTAAALAGGLVRISDQANNILANGGKLWAGTQANYEALSSYDSNTVYLTV